MKGVNIKKTIIAEINKPIDLTASWIGSYNWTPEPPAGKERNRTLTIKPFKADTYTYVVKDSISPSRTCISDTFEIKATSPVSSSLKFDARQKHNSVLLKWSTEKESNIDYYTIERSSNGRDFTILTMIKATVVSNLNSSSLIAAAVAVDNTYEFEDNYPVHGSNYYRLKKTFRDAQTILLGQRVINFEAVKSFTYTVNPNALSKNMININVESSKKQLLQVKMFDMTGKLVYHNNLSASQGSNNVKIIVTAGMYVLNIVAPDNTRVSDKILLK